MERDRIILEAFTRGKVKRMEPGIYSVMSSTMAEADTLSPRDISHAIEPLFQRKPLKSLKGNTVDDISQLIASEAEEAIIRLPSFEVVRAAARLKGGRQMSSVLEEAVQRAVALGLLAGRRNEEAD